MPAAWVCCYVIEIFRFCLDVRRRDRSGRPCRVKQLKAQKRGKSPLACLSRAFGALFTPDREDQIYTGVREHHRLGRDDASSSAPSAMWLSAPRARSQLRTGQHEWRRPLVRSQSHHMRTVKVEVKVERRLDRGSELTGAVADTFELTSGAHESS